MGCLSFRLLRTQLRFVPLCFFLDLRALIAESVKPTSSGNHFCTICAKVISRHRYKRHFVDCHWTGAPSYFCPAPNCQKQYSSKGAFSKHKERHHPDWKGVSLDTFVVNE